jgi:site-specific recombinase XerC
VVERVEQPREIPSFHRFASEWFDRQVREGGRRGEGLSKRGREDLEWRLSKHILRFFGPMRLDAISILDVDRFRGQKRAQGLSPSSVNKLLACLSAILEQAREYRLIEHNPAAGKRRRLPATRPDRAYLDRADHFAALLAGAGKVDDDALLRKGQRRALVAVLLFAGLRRAELLALRWKTSTSAEARSLSAAARPTQRRGRSTCCPRSAMRSTPSACARKSNLTRWCSRRERANR